MTPPLGLFGFPKGSPNGRGGVDAEVIVEARDLYIYSVCANQPLVLPLLHAQVISNLTTGCDTFKKNKQVHGDTICITLNQNWFKRTM